MHVGILITDGGTHPPEKWAQVTASQIMAHIGRRSRTVSLHDANVFEAKLLVLLTNHHTLVQNHERAALAVEGTERLAGEIDTSGHLPDAVDDIIALANGTTLAGHFARPDEVIDNEDGTETTIFSTRVFLERLLHEHFHHAMHVHRSWHADAYPDHPHAVAFRENQTNGIGAAPVPTLQSDVKE